MTVLLLSAGRSTRLGDHAPAGCKALVRVGGQTILDHWRAIFPGLTVVCRSEHLVELADEDVTMVATDDLGGAAQAVQAGLRHESEHGPVTIIYADTWVPASCVPKGVDWAGVAAAIGGRRWYVAEGQELIYQEVPPGEVAVVGIGLFRFGSAERLADTIETCMAVHSDGGEVGMDVVANAYGVSLRPVIGWQDVGDEHALATWRAL